MFKTAITPSIGLQVIDLHRDRLEHTQSELADARNRIVDLEATQCRSHENLKMSSERLLQAGTSRKIRVHHWIANILNTL